MKPVTRKAAARLKIAICHPLQGRGGSEARAMWAAQALASDHAVSLVTAGPVELEALDEAYGTCLVQARVPVVAARTSVRLQRLHGGDALKSAVYQRHCQDVASTFDVLISAYNLVDFGRPAIQCIADFSWDEAIRRSHDVVPKGGRGWFHRLRPLRKLYLAVGRLLARPTGRDLFAGEDLLLANSEWTSHLLSERWGVTAPVLYPPVLDIFPSVDWSGRSPDFVCLGRVSPEKRIEDVIEIVRRVREHGHPARLRIVGEASSTAYRRSIQLLCREAGSWAVCEARRDGAAKADLLAACRYALHARRKEAFGIAVAEMLTAGCIPFVPQGGGPAEIVGTEDLVYSSKEDAVAKICAVLVDVDREEALRRGLRRQRSRFGVERFCAELSGHVTQFARRNMSASRYESRMP